MILVVMGALGLAVLIGMVMAMAWFESLVGGRLTLDMRQAADAEVPSPRPAELWALKPPA
jgi:hypothetical protein